MRTFSDKDLLAGVAEGDTRMIARFITLCENRVPRARALLEKLPQLEKPPHVIGITGSPGAGKSSLVDHLALKYAEAGKKVAVVAIDPSSPFSGGAVLGDRIRMVSALSNENVFVRSMATRGALGGISRGTHDALLILQSSTFDVVIIETVGVGQAEVDIVRSADTCAVVLVPGMGDSVQSLKAGILEIADLFVINKSDLFGADILEKDLRVLIGLVDLEEGGWETPIKRTVATKAEGIDEVIASMDEHLVWVRNSELGSARTLQMTKQRLLQLFLDDVREQIERNHGEVLARLGEELVARKTTFPEAFSQLKYAYTDQKT